MSAAARPQPDADGAAAEVVFCFPHAGGGMHSFLSWARLLDGRFDWVPVDYAGHYTRDDEPLYHTFADAVQDLAGLVEQQARGRAVGLYGHSLGGSLAFEVARRLERTGPVAVTAVVVGGAEPPSALRTTRERRFELDDEQFLEHLDQLDGSGTDPRRRALLLEVLPLIRADYRLHHSYRPDPDAAVRAPLHVCCGADERELRSQQEHWDHHGRGQVVHHTFRGGHFSWHTDLPAVVRTLSDVFAPRSRPGSVTGPGRADRTSRGT